MGKKKLTWALIVVLVVIVLVIVYSYAFTSQGNKEKIVVGSVIPLSGPIAIVGEDLQRGIILAVEEINAEGGIDGKELKVVFEDDQCNPKQTVTAFTKLVEVDGVSAVIGPFCSGSTLAAAPIANLNNVVIVSPGSTSPDITTAGDFVFRVTPSDLFEANFMSEIIKEDFDKVAVINVNNEWASDMTNVFADSLHEDITIIQEFNDQDKDVRSQLLRIRETDPEALVLFVYPQHYGFVTKQIVELGIDAQLFAAHTFETPTSFGLGNDAERYRYATLGLPDSTKTEEFFEGFDDKYDRQPSVWAALSYDSTRVLAQAMKGCDSNALCIRDNLYSMEDYQGVSGTKSFDENGDIKDSLYQIIFNFPLHITPTRRIFLHNSIPCNIKPILDRYA